MHYRLRLITACAFLALVPQFASAQKEALATPLSLQDCIDFAMHNADTIKNARLAIRKQNEENNQIKAGALPRINGKGEFDDFVNPQQSLLPLGFIDGKPEDLNKFTPVQFSPKYTANTSLTGNQALFDGTLLVALKARKTVMEVATQAAKLTEENVKYSIQKAYFAVIVGIQQQKTLAISLATAREMMHDVDALYKAGFEEKIAVERTQVQLTNLETDSLRTASLLETGKQALKYTIGMDINQPVELTDTSITDNVNTAIVLVTEELDYAKRTEYQLSLGTIKLLDYNLKRYQLAAYPTLNAFGNMGYNYGSNTFSDLTKFNGTYLFSSLVGLQLNVPIFNGFLRRSQVNEAKIDLELAKNRLHLLKQSLDFQTAQAQTTLKNALLAVNKQKLNLELSNSVLDLSRKKAKAGVGSNLEVNQAQTDLLLSQNNYYTALLDVINAQADVQKALGMFAQ